MNIEDVFAPTNRISPDQADSSNGGDVGRRRPALSAVEGALSDASGPAVAELPPEPPVRSLYKYSYLEALRHKWIASEKAGCDLGEKAILEWLHCYWSRWCRARWLEHLMGVTFWAEFDEDSFGSLARNFQGDSVLLDRVLDRVCAGWENLDIIQWAADWTLDIDEVIEILILLDINRSRLDSSALLAAP